MESRHVTNPKYRISTTDSNHNLPIAPNHLNQQFTVSKPNQVWLTDFTYIPTKEGFSYLCAFTGSLFADESSVGQPVGRLTRNWQSPRWIRLLHCASRRAGVIIHSDRGSQFASMAFRTTNAPIATPTEHEPQRKLLRQRADGKFFQKLQSRRGISRNISNPRTCARASCRLHRSVLQSNPIAFGTGLHQSKSNLNNSCCADKRR